MRRLGYLAAVVVAAVGVGVGFASSAAAASCTPTGFVRDGIDLTAALIDPIGTVTGTIDASGCNIGIYYGSGATGAVQYATVENANYFGIVNDGGTVTVMNSTVTNIGEQPFNGTQHGVGIYFTYDSGATGTIKNNVVEQYQKGGIVVNGPSDSASISGNVVNGLGVVDFIAQNGIQLGWAASGAVFNNTVTGNAYSGANDASSTGILIFGGNEGDPSLGSNFPYASGISVKNNTVTDNDIGIYLYNSDINNDSPAAPTNNVIQGNKITDSNTTNVSGNGDPNGYQVGITEYSNGDTLFNNKIGGAGYDSANEPTTDSLYAPTDTQNVQEKNDKIS